MAKHILNLPFHILKHFFYIVSYWMVFTSLVSYCLVLHFSLQIWIEENTRTYHFTIHIMKVPKSSAVHIPDVVGKSAIYYPHHEGASSLLSAFIKKIAGLYRHHECGMLH
jgi:hypothetical protein